MITRSLAAFGVLVSGVVHLWLWYDGFRYVSVIGPLFLLNAAAGVVIAGLLLTWRHWLAPLIAVGFGASTLGAFLISATVGLFGVNEVFWGVSQMIAALAEILAIVAGCLVIWQENRTVLGDAWADHRPGHLRTHPH